jgi:hypothetical protein
MEDCIDDLNDFHFKKSKVNLPSFDNNFKTQDNDNEENYFIVHMVWLAGNCDGYNK